MSTDPHIVTPAAATDEPELSEIVAAIAAFEAGMAEDAA